MTNITSAVPSCAPREVCVGGGGAGKGPNPNPIPLKTKGNKF